MFRLSNTLVAILNAISLLISFASVGASFLFRLHADSDCQRFLQTPLLIVGLVLFFISILGLIGSGCKVTWLLRVYLLLIILLICGLFCFTIVALVVTNKGVGQAISGRGFKEYRLGDYSHWLQKYVVNGKNWDEIRSCLVDAQVCRSLGGDLNQKAADFYKKNLSPIQSGCCKPPTHCGFEYKNATFWMMPKSGPAVPDSDCMTWNNDGSKLCYDCKSCKGGVLANIKKEWWHLTIFNVALIVFLITVKSIACCALRNSKKDQKYSRYKGYP